MTRIICAENCGNSPKNRLLRDFTAALARGNDAFVLKHLTNDVVWQWVGAAPLQGKDAVSGLLARLKHEPRQEVIMANIITHGPAGAVNGSLRLTNGRSYDFCHVFEFTGAAGRLIQRITTFEIRGRPGKSA